MTVRELVAKLAEMDQDAVVMVEDYEYGQEPAHEVAQRETTGFERGIRRRAPWWEAEPLDPPVHAVVIR